MERYLIKATYITGRHAGKSYLLRKGGYVTDETDWQWECTTYKTKAICERVCRHYKEENDFNYKHEREYEAYRVGKGYEPKGYYTYELETYEPYKVDASKDII